MRFGLFAINSGICADPDVASEVAQAAEAAGFESVWTGEHVVLPDPQVPPSPVGPFTPFLDPAVALSFIAARTATIKLGTGIIILPQRNPLVLAKEMVSVDFLSKGRLLFGVGVGYLEPEFRALGYTLDHRGRRRWSTSTPCGRCGARINRATTVSSCRSPGSSHDPVHSSSRPRPSTWGATARPGGAVR